MRFTWANLWLILHILAVVVGFGPNFGFAVLAALGQKEPQHAAFATKVIQRTTHRLGEPMAIVILLTGIALIVTKRYDFWASEWLIASVALFIVAFTFANLVQDRNVKKMAGYLDQMTAGEPPPGGPEAVVALGKKLQYGGIFLSLVIITFVVLMVLRPGSAFLPPPVP